MLIGELSKRVGVPTSTIRYYEKMRLIPRVRDKNGYRKYPEEVVSLLELIIKAKSLGFTLSEIREFSTLLQELGLNKGNIRKKLESKVDDLDNRIKELKMFKKNINQLLKARCPL